MFLTYTPTNSSTYQPKVVSLDGKTIQKQNLKLGEQTVVVNTEGWAKGIYFMQIVSNSKVVYEEKLSLQ